MNYCWSECRSFFGWLPLEGALRQCCETRRSNSNPRVVAVEATERHWVEHPSHASDHDNNNTDEHGSSSSGRRSRWCCCRSSRPDRFWCCCCRCCQRVFTTTYVLLFLCLVAAIKTFHASWSCQTFASDEDLPIGLMWYFGGGFGVWTVMDAQLECQLWSTLFFAHTLDGYLRAAQICSMMAMLVGLAVVAILTETMPCRWWNWGTMIAYLIWVVDSFRYDARFNLWRMFFGLTYLFMVLAARYWFPHYFPSIPSRRRVVRWLLAVATLTTLGISLVLVSNVCSCYYMKQLMEVHLGPFLSGNETWPADVDEGTFMGTPINFTSSSADDDNNNDDTTILSQLLSNYTAWPLPTPLPASEDEDFANCSNSCESWSFVPYWSSGLWFLSWLVFPYCSIHTTTTNNSSNNNNANTNSTMIDRTSTTDSVDTENRVAEEATSKVIVVDAEEEDGVGSIRSERNEEVEDPTATQARSDHHSRTTDPGDTQEDPINEPSQQQRGVTEKDLPRPTGYAIWRGRLSRCVCRIILTVLVLLYLFVVVVMIGAYVENVNAANAPDTSHNFVTETVCAFNPVDPAASYVTFAHKREAIAAGFAVLHCGACAQCSNPADIAKYVTTRQTVAKSAKRCSKTTIFGSYDDLNECLEEQIGFSRPCTECWADNMQTTAKYCLFTCLSSVLTGNTRMNNLAHADDYNWLNQCLFCDEKRSGPAFVTCSGVARRRLGIPSEIERNPAEQCQSVDVNYLNATSANYFFNYYNNNQ